MKSLHRRTFLRGLGASIALPVLDAMTPAFAATRKAVPRLSFMYIPNGINIAQWTPSGSGKGFAFSPTLKSLEPFRERVNVLSGLALHSADRTGLQYRARSIAERAELLTPRQMIE